MNNKTTTKANPVKPNTSSKLNTDHKGICQKSQAVQVLYTGDSGSVSTNQQNLSDEQFKHLTLQPTAGHKPAQHQNSMKNINTNGAAVNNGNNNSNVVRKAFGGFSKPQTLAEGDHAAVISSIEQVTGTDSKNKPVVNGG